MHWTQRFNAPVGISKEPFGVGPQRWRTDFQEVKLPRNRQVSCFYTPESRSKERGATCSGLGYGILWYPEGNSYTPPHTLRNKVIKKRALWKGKRELTRRKFHRRRDVRRIMGSGGLRREWARQRETHQKAPKLSTTRNEHGPSLLKHLRSRVVDIALGFERQIPKVEIHTEDTTITSLIPLNNVPGMVEISLGIESKLSTAMLRFELCSIPSCSTCQHQAEKRTEIGGNTRHYRVEGWLVTRSKFAKKKKRRKREKTGFVTGWKCDPEPGEKRLEIKRRGHQWRADLAG